MECIYIYNKDYSKNTVHIIIISHQCNIFCTFHIQIIIKFVYKYSTNIETTIIIISQDVSVVYICEVFLKYVKSINDYINAH